MKYLIASDIHGSAYWTERLVTAIDSEQPDRIVLLGDLLYHGPRNDLPRDYAPKRRPRARAARGLRARLRSHARQGQRGKRRAPGPVALQPR